MNTFSREEYRNWLRPIFSAIEKQFLDVYLVNLELRKQLESLQKKTKITQKKQISNATQTEINNNNNTVQYEERRAQTPEEAWAPPTKESKKYSVSFLFYFRPHTDSICDIGHVKASNSLVTSSCDSTVKVWNFKSGDAEQQVVSPSLIYTGHSSSVNCSISSAKYENIICSGGGDGTIHIWSCKSLVEEFKETSGKRPPSTFLSDNTNNTNNTNNNNALYVRSPVSRIVGHELPISCMDWLGSHLITGSWDNTVRLYDVNSEACLTTLMGHERMVTHIKPVSGEADPTNVIASCSEDKTIRLWDTRQKNCGIKVLHGHTNTVTSLIAGHAADDADQPMLISSGKDKTCRVWDIRMLKQIPVGVVKFGSPINSLAMYQDAKKYVTVSEDSGSVSLCNPNLQHLFKVTSLIYPRKKAAATSTAFVQGGAQGPNLFVSFSDLTLAAFSFRPNPQR